MQPLKINIKGRIPSKKNSKIIVCRGKYPVLLPSSAHKQWHTEQSLLLANTPHIEGSCEIDAVFYFPDNRPSDLSNKWESIGDLLVDCGILEDDNAKIIKQLTLVYAGVDKENPRCELNIWRDE